MYYSGSPEGKRGQVCVEFQPHPCQMPFLSFLKLNNVQLSSRKHTRNLNATGVMDFDVSQAAHF